MNKNFIVFEGVEGSGKSTIVKLLHKKINSLAIKSIVTREPGGTDLGNEIREILLNNKSVISPMSEFLLLSAARAQHVSYIQDKLNEDFIVICDRFYDSSIAYQGYGRGLDLNIIKSVNNIVVEGLHPDIVFIFDIDPYDAFLRIEHRKKDRIENEGLDFFERIRQGYLKLAKEHKNYVVLDANLSVDELFKMVLTHLEL